MRVIAGLYKRRILTTVPGNAVTRPTSDRVKESIFNILNDTCIDARVLDLFAGSGALGIEALSRGAAHVTFVENNRDAIKSIKSNLETLQIPTEQYQIVPTSVVNFLAYAAKSKFTSTGASTESTKKMDIILVDPPYNSPWYRDGMYAIEVADICNIGACIILEKGAKMEISPENQNKNLHKVDERHYGRTVIEIWRNR